MTRKGVGKTTLVRKICQELLNSSKENSCQGFYTEELRSARGLRIGFDVVSLQGKRGILARETTADGLKRPKIGKYSVFVSEFEELVLPLLLPRSGQLMVIDEIGKMELLSKKFENSVVSLLDQQVPLLATIPQQTRQTITTVEKLKSSNSKIFDITKLNRNQIAADILQCIEECVLRK